MLHFITFMAIFLSFMYHFSSIALFSICKVTFAFGFLWKCCNNLFNLKIEFWIFSASKDKNTQVKSIHLKDKVSIDALED